MSRDYKIGDENNKKPQAESLWQVGIYSCALLQGIELPLTHISPSVFFSTADSCLLWSHPKSKKSNIKRDNKNFKLAKGVKGIIVAKKKIDNAIWWFVEISENINTKVGWISDHDIIINK